MGVHSAAPCIFPCSHPVQPETDCVEKKKNISWEAYSYLAKQENVALWKCSI